MELAANRVSAQGEFSLVFNSEILGLEYLAPIDAEIRAKGHVSDLYADEDGPV